MKPVIRSGTQFTVAIFAGGTIVIERVITASAGLGQSETILITNKPDEYRHLELEMCTDILPCRYVKAAANLLTMDKINPRAKIPDFKMAAVPAGEGGSDGPSMLEEQGAIKDPTRFVH